MKIIKPGNLPEEKEYRAQCNNCNCVFEFKRGEAKIDSSGSYRNETYLTIGCPTCMKLVYVDISR